MTKHFLNIRESGRSSDMKSNITYKFGLETPLIFSIFSDEKKEYQQLKIKTNKNNNEFFRGCNGKGGIGGVFEPVNNYWNLCVPDDNKGFSMAGYNDKLTLDNVEGKIYLELYSFPHSTLKIKPKKIIHKIKEKIWVEVVPIKTSEQNMEISQIELEGEKNAKFHSIIANCIEKDQDLTIKFLADNGTYFRKIKKTNSLVIPENSLQEDLLTQNNSSPQSDKSFYFLLGVLILVFLFLVYFLTKSQKSRKK